MIIKNNFIKINNGKKECELRNHIQNWYISYYSLRQYNADGTYADLRLNILFIKFDESLNNPAYGEGYDIQLNGTVSQESSNNYVKTDYYYRTSDLHNIDIDLMKWYGYKIYTLGFGLKGSGTGTSIGAYLDVSDYDIYLTEDGFLDVIREDLMSSDAICGGTPYHLAPLLNNKTGLIYSVGFGTIPDVMQEEYIVGDAVELVPITDGFQFTLGGTTDFTQYPQIDLYPVVNIFPLPYIIQTPELDPLVNLYPAVDLYPQLTNYKYVIYKYRVYNYINPTYDVEPTNEYYLVSYPFTKKGVITINTFYERNDA